MPITISIQNKITLLASLCLIAVVGSLLTLSIEESKSNTASAINASNSILTDAAKQNLQTQAALQASLIQREFSRAYDFGLGVQRQILFLRAQARRNQSTPSALRHDLNATLRDALAQHSDILGLFTSFLPNKLDGVDGAFRGRTDLGSNDQGRFAIYWLQPSAGTLNNVSGDEQLLADETPGPSGAPFNSFYTCPIKSKIACLISPYFDSSSGTKRLVTSISFPIMENGEVIGVIGIDIGLDNLQRNAESGAKAIYAGQSTISIVSSSGVLSAHTADSTKVGSLLNQALPQSAKSWADAIHQGVTKSLESGQSVTAFVPISPIDDSANWTVIVDVPKSVLEAPTRNMSEMLDEQRLKSSGVELFTGLIVAAFGALMMWLTARGITRPILRVAHRLEEIADGDGDLTQRLTHNKGDELGRLSVAFNRFLDKLQPVISKVQGSVGLIRETASQSALIADQTNSGMQKQFGEIDQVASALHEMSVTANTSSQSAAQAADAARRAEQATAEGLEMIAKTMEAIRSQASAMSKGMEDLEKLGYSSQQIGSVLEVILSIAGQTNLLALNAAIEAARAGEAGRGFAVVADEVRSLARRTQDSVEEIRGVIESLQAGSNSVTHSMNIGHGLAQDNVLQAQMAVAALERIDAAVNEISEMNLLIASSAEEQSSVAEEINRNVSFIRDVTESLSDQAEHAASISHELNNQANQQQQLIGQFRT
ncbi:methyl-accepting chemotaxis sensory transducer with Cache sensor [Pseudomonas reinekei]|jgi:methyl-accepting chemotaxis protein|uniref:Chemotaxis protein n=2 Tax=Pseudomonas reinekei TaxID=395598 RepID=A0A1H0IPK8_PSERE|nr:methyl-accepting chemotaxis protein [Pseudomonas reinekei]KAB0486663.1 methyl-accepting chemotaxis protein [Pseudomonas reinekei]OLU04339.1 chemotaxis protein [Pseudomonas reinekei]SDO33293.1 methyl-accepting chemotaxis sensory transducer with Cache sensor [Pseudomonas reinekei]